MTDIIENMTREELVAKCTNQRIELNNMLRCHARHDIYEASKERVIRTAIKHLKQARPTVALSTLQGYIRKADQCLRELALHPDEGGE